MYKKLKEFPGGGGGGRGEVEILFPTFKNNYFLKIVDRDSGNLYPIYPLFPGSDFFISNVGGGGGNVFLECYAISNISRKTKFWE